MSHKLIKKIVYTGVIKLKTGLHIGGTNAALNIGERPFLEENR